MTILTVVVPVLPGKQEAWRQFCQTLQGSRRDEYRAWREQMRISQEAVWLVQTTQGDVVCLHLQAEHPEQVVRDLSASPHPFDSWLRQGLLELHGLDLMQLVKRSAHERLFVWPPIPFTHDAVSGKE